MTELYSKDNLFTTFNNIEKIKKEKQERKVKQVIRVEEMIQTIKEHYNLNAPMLADNLGVNVQSVYKWENGGRPSITSYNKIKELYEEITRENKTEVLEQPETALKPLEIANKEVIEDVTAGTPFIELTFDVNGKKRYVNINNIHEISETQTTTCISFSEEDYTHVKESITEVLELIRKKIKEDEKN